MKYKKIFIFICLIIGLFSIVSVCASDVNETIVASEDQVLMESQDDDFKNKISQIELIENNISLNSDVFCSDNFNEQYGLLSSPENDDILPVEENGVLGDSIHYTDYAVSVSDTTIYYGESGNIDVYISQGLQHKYQFDFYLRVYDINGNQKISQRYDSSNSVSKVQVSYHITSNQLNCGIYKIQLENYADNYVMDTATLNIVSLPSNVYSASIEDTIINYKSSDKIYVDISPAYDYYYKYDFYLKIYDSSDVEKFSQRYYSTSSSYRLTCDYGNQLFPGNYIVKIFNMYDGYVMDTANLIVKSAPSYTYSVSVSDTDVNYGSEDSIYINISPASSYYDYKYDFYLKVYDSSDVEKISQRYYSTSSSSQLTYNGIGYMLTPGSYTVKIFNSFDGQLMDTANLNIISLPSSAFSVSVSDTKVNYDSRGDIIMNISPAPSNYSCKYDFYLKVYDSNNVEKISKRYYSNSKSYIEHYSIYSNELKTGHYDVKILNSYDGQVMSSANLTIVATVYSVTVSDTIVGYGKYENIYMNISTGYGYGSSTKYDFNLKIYDLNNVEKINQRFYGTISGSQLTYSIDSQLNPGKYSVILVNNYNDQIMDTANLTIKSISSNDYSVSIFDKVINYGSSGSIDVSISPASSSNFYRYDFYLKVYDSNDVEKISQRYYSTSSSSTVTYNIDSTQLVSGKYAVKIVNVYDGLVMDVANLTIMSISSSSYVVSVSDTVINYGSSGSINIKINSYSLYNRKYDFYLKVFDSDNTEKISHRYYSSDSMSSTQLTYIINPTKLNPGNYSIKIVNVYDGQVMDTANLTIMSISSMDYSVNVYNTIFSYGTGGSMHISITSASSGYYGYDFYFKVFDLNNIEKINQRYYGTSNSYNNYYYFSSTQLDPGVYVVKVVNVYDGQVMDTANLTVLALTFNDYSVSVSDTTINHDVVGCILMDVVPASSIHSHLYDFYLNVFDSNGIQVISERYCSSSFCSQLSYDVGSYQLRPGNYVVKVVNVYDGQVMDTANLTVLALTFNDYSVSVSDVTFTYGSNGSIIMGVVPASFIHSHLYDFYLNVFDSNGIQVISERYCGSSLDSLLIYKINSTRLDPGVYVVKVVNVYDGQVMDTANLIINSVSYTQYSVNVSDLKMIYGMDSNIFINVTSFSQMDYYKYDFYLNVFDSNGIQVISERYFGSSSNSQFLYKINSNRLNKGIYDIKILNNVDNYVMDSAKLHVLDLSNLNVSSGDYYVTEIVKIDYDVASGATGYLKVYLNGTYLKSVFVGNQIELGYLSNGHYNVEVEYVGDDYYVSSKDNTSFNVYKLDSEYYIDYDDIIAGENNYINFIFDEDATGNVTVSFGYWLLDENNNDVWEDNYNFTDQLSDGKVSFTIPDLEGGWIDYILKYSGDDRYDSLNESDYIWVSYKDSPISINIPEISWSDNVILKPILPKSATGNIHLLLDNISLANISIGDTFQYKANKGGKHYLTIEYSGDEYFTYNETTVEFYVNKLNSNFNMESTFDSEKYITIPITLNNDANGFITVNVNNNIYSGDVINGSFNLTVTDLGAGTHNAIINYTGDDKYNDIYIAKEITVNLKNSNLNLNISNILKDENLLIKPNLAEGATGTVSIYVDGELKRTINVGSSYTLAKPAIGQHKIKLIYFGNTYFDSAEKEFSFRVFTKYPIEAVDTQIVYGTDKKFQAKFYDEYGEILANKYVSFIVNGTEYPIRTNSEGIAVLDVDLGVGEYNITSVSLLDESTTNKLLIFHSIQAESMIIEYGSNTRFKARFLDETANPLKNTRIVFNVDGKDTMVTTDVDGVAILNTELAMGAHYITSINTITDENMTNKVVIVSGINSILTVEVSDINYGQNTSVKVNIDSGCLNADVTVKVTGENGYEQIFTQKAAKTITKEVSGLNASKYRVDVKYVDYDLLTIDKNTTFTVSKIDPTITLNVDDAVIGDVATLTINIPQATGVVEIKLGSESYDEQLIDGMIVKELFDFKIGENTIEVFYKGDNNFNPLIKTTAFKAWNNFDLDVAYESEIMENEEYFIDINNLDENTNEDNLILFIDGVKHNHDFSIRYDDEDTNHIQISFIADLSEGEHIWEITYLDNVNYINTSKSVEFSVIVPPQHDTYQFALITNKSVINIPFDKITWNVKTVSVYDEYLAEYYDDPYVNYTFSTFTLDNIGYVIITSSENPSFASLAVPFNPNGYIEHDGIYYAVKDGEITDVIGYSDYNVYDNEYYRIVGSGYKTFSENAGAVEYALVNGECYKITGTMGASTAMFNRAIQNVDYKIVNGKYYTLNDELIENLLDESYGSDYAVINGTFYDINGNIYTPHAAWTIGDVLINNNGELSKVVYGKDYNNSYAVDDGKLFAVVGDAVGEIVDVDMNQSVENQTSENTTDINETVEPEIDIPSLDNVSEEGNVVVTLPSDATGTVTLTVGGKDYIFDVKDGVANVKLPELENGNYDYTITYSGDSKYSSFVNNGSLIVNNVNPVENQTSENTTDVNETVVPEIDVPSLDNVSDDGIVVITLPGDATGTVTLSVGGKDYVFDVFNGVANVKLPELENGNYSYTITYSGDSKYSSFVSNGNMKVNNTKSEDVKPTPQVVIPSLDEPSEDGSVSISLPDDATGTVTLTINGKEYYFAVVKGAANIIIPDLGDGNYPYTITYSGDSKYSSFTTNGTLNKVAPAIDPVITASNVKVTYATGKYYTIKVYGTDGELADGVKVVISVKGKTFKALTTSNGVARFKVTNVPGTYKMNITALGKSVTKTLTVKHLVTLKSVTVKRSAKKLTLQANLGKVNGKYLKNKKITFKFNGKKYTAKTDKKGVAKVTIKSSVLKKLKVGKKVTYQATYSKDTVKKTVKVKK